MKILLLVLIPYHFHSQNNFKRCDTINFGMYYANEHGKERYKTESKIVKEYIINQFKAKYDTSQNGYITFRFFVNCYGQAGNFTSLEVDENYQSFQFNTSIKNQLLNIISKMDIYKIKYGYRDVDKGKPIDYFLFFTFKIINGEINAILP